MSVGQLWLLPPPRPLVERLGPEFFRQLPDRPGVYLMCGPREGVLYVGRAKSLRRRLGNYRVANPERLARRIIRLLHQVTRIEWDECPDEAAAVCREELLIATLNPKFNPAGKAWPLEGPARHRLNSTPGPHGNANPAYSFPVWAHNASTTSSWSARWGRPETVTAPMIPAPVTVRGKEPPCAA
jgi:hypothetical protein